MIGGWAKNFKGGAKLGSGPHFVVEGDEYDTAFFDKGPKFLHYQPRWAILTSIEFDHGDIYKDMDHIKSAFRAFVKLLPSDGTLVAAHGFPDVDDVIHGLACPLMRYGLESVASNHCGSHGGIYPASKASVRGRLHPALPVEGATQAPIIDWQARAIHPKSSGIQFEAVYQGRPFARVDSPLLGRHNVLNALAVVAMAYHLGLSKEEILQGVATFQGVKRRQDVVGVVNDIMIMDDFAHHPTAIHETLAGVRAGFPARRLWAVFEPRSATSRSKIFQETFARAFQEADEVIIANLYAPEKIQPQERLDPAKLVEDIQKKGQKARFIPTADEIVKELASHLRPGDIVCVMSSGGFGGIHSKLIAALQDQVKP
jgi:UDP-N-acetylmuramate: L-alanyl-gamma-D-glutamyl-meso-diaminopimelate ligase